MQKLRQNHETIQQLTFQMQEHMNSMNCSGEFQDVESNSSGWLSHVSSQLAMTIIGTLMEKENCQIRGQVSQSSRYWMKNHQIERHGPGETNKKQTISRPDNVWPDMWQHMSDASKRKERQKWAIEKSSSRRIRRTLFSNPSSR